MKNPLGQNQGNLAWTRVDANNVRVEFAGDIEYGTWEYILLYWKAGSEFNEPKKFKTLPIGGWNLHANRQKVLPHGLPDFKKIQTISAYVYNDAETRKFNLLGMANPTLFAFQVILIPKGKIASGAIDVDDTNVQLWVPNTTDTYTNWFDRYPIQPFANTNINRGEVIIEYTD